MKDSAAQARALEAKLFAAGQSTDERVAVLEEALRAFGAGRDEAAPGWNDAIEAVWIVADCVDCDRAHGPCAEHAVTSDPLRITPLALAEWIADWFRRDSSRSNGVTGRGDERMVTPLQMAAMLCAYDEARRNDAPPCGEGNVDKTTCILVQGHDGTHYDGIGYWAGTSALKKKVSPIDPTDACATAFARPTEEDKDRARRFLAVNGTMTQGDPQSEAIVAALIRNIRVETERGRSKASPERAVAFMLATLLGFDEDTGQMSDPADWSNWPKRLDEDTRNALANAWRERSDEPPSRAWLEGEAEALRQQLADTVAERDALIVEKQRAWRPEAKNVDLKQSAAKGNDDGEGLQRRRREVSPDDDPASSEGRGRVGQGVSRGPQRAGQGMGNGHLERPEGGDREVQEVAEGSRLTGEGADGDVKALRDMLGTAVTLAQAALVTWGTNHARKHVTAIAELCRERATK